MVEDISKYKDTFLSEAKEHLSAMNKALLTLEDNPTHVESIAEIFRAAHTLKGMAGVMRYEKTQKLCHVIEDILDAVKKKTVRIEDCVDVLFESFDTLELTLKELKKNKEEMNTDVLVEKLNLVFSKDPSRKKVLETSKEIASPIESIESVEVKVERLDLLMNLAEALLINEIRLDKIKETLKDPELSAAVDSLGRLVTDLQYNIMQARLVPVGFIFNRFPRMVRDLAKQEKKEVSLEIEGGDIELDRSVINEIGESLVHLLRNAVDHGIEAPQVREEVGKNPIGTIKLRVTRAKSVAILSVSDDGSGLDLEAIKNVALKEGRISPRATNDEVIQSIFSNISTTEQVTDVSGRGVGLNVVKNKIESIGGTIRVESERGKGTIFTIEIPLTLAIIKSLYVRVGTKTYAIPLVNIERLVVVDRKDMKKMVNHEAIVIDEEEVLVTRLDELFGTPCLNLEKQPIVVVWKGKEKLGLAVDALLTTQEMVIKPLNKLIRENTYFAGSTIIGTGEVVLILDVGSLILTKQEYAKVSTKQKSM